MKSNKCFFTLLFVLHSFTSFSQTYKPFRIGVGMGFSSSGYILPGVLFYLEPSFRPQDNISVGLRIESVFKSNNNDVPLLGSYSLNGQYYFYSDGRIRFFTGLGVGIYRPNKGALGSCTCSDDPKINPVFGGYPRFGFDYRHLVFTIDYNLAPSIRMVQHLDDIPPAGTPVTYYNNRTSYLSFKIGFFLSGGRYGRREF